MLSNVVVVLFLYMLSDFRPISILPFLFKVLEYIVNMQLMSFLSSNNLLSLFNALLKVIDDIRLILLDFCSALHSVDYGVLLASLRSFNVLLRLQPGLISTLEAACSVLV